MKLKRKVKIIIIVLLISLVSIKQIYKVNDELSLRNNNEDSINISWNLRLVNKWNPIDKNYKFNLKKLSNGHQVDERCYEDLINMLNDCKEDGNIPVICSSYRSYEKQEELFNNKVDILLAEGYTKENSKELATQSIALPGTSEHQLGLAVDIVDINYQLLDNNQEKTNVQQWLIENSWKYGFILRYPNNKSTITGIVYEPWHYRYVGKEAAKEIKELGICLEEYLIKKNTF